jgi:hypothetical protein
MPSDLPSWVQNAGWGIALFLIVWRLFTPRRECILIHQRTEAREEAAKDKLERAVSDIADEKDARHALSDSLQPIALKVARLEEGQESIKQTVSETRDLVRALASRPV